jgi:carbamoyl-phosphate synthase small subunit
MRCCSGVEWATWLAERGILGLAEVDTRAVVLKLRSAGAMRAAVVADERELEVSEAVERVRAQPLMEGRGLVAQVSPAESYVYSGEGRVRVALVDYGTKRSILRRLEAAGAAVTVHPPSVDADELSRYDGVLLANGPGDPEPLHEEVAQIERLLGRTSILGICLGHQLLGLATGHATYKLPFGHRGANHPVLERATGRVLVTSQNHGFAVKPSDAAEASYVSLYDGTVEGLDIPELRARSVQFHPEASPGTHDAYPILERWVDELAAEVGR